MHAVLQVKAMLEEKNEEFAFLNSLKRIQLHILAAVLSFFLTIFSSYEKELNKEGEKCAWKDGILIPTITSHHDNDALRFWAYKLLLCA